MVGKLPDAVNYNGKSIFQLSPARLENSQMLSREWATLSREELVRERSVPGMQSDAQWPMRPRVLCA